MSPQRVTPFRLLLDATTSYTQSIEDLKNGMVNITALADGMTKVGAGKEMQGWESKLKKVYSLE